MHWPQPRAPPACAFVMPRCTCADMTHTHGCTGWMLGLFDPCWHASTCVCMMNAGLCSYGAEGGGAGIGSISRRARDGQHAGVGSANVPIRFRMRDIHSPGAGVCGHKQSLLSPRQFKLRPGDGAVLHTHGGRSALKGHVPRLRLPRVGYPHGLRPALSLCDTYTCTCACAHAPTCTDASAHAQVRSDTAGPWRRNDPIAMLDVTGPMHCLWAAHYAHPSHRRSRVRGSCPLRKCVCMYVYIYITHTHVHADVYTHSRTCTCIHRCVSRTTAAGVSTRRKMALPSPSAALLHRRARAPRPPCRFLQAIP